MEIADEIEVCQNVEPHEVEKTIKSKAVVKFSQVQVPVKFNRLECNTNLNLPPSNWLTSADNSYGLHQALYHSPGFASFRMAHMFPDCVGEVDVVADAENIKKLLKLPYTSKGSISMIVHKVGNTLLLDEFDIQKYLLRKADDDWKWLKTFILEHILAYGDGSGSFCLKDKSREAIQTKNLLSKFLYYSLKQSGATDDDDDDDNQPAILKKRASLPIKSPVLPEPKVEENVPDPNSAHVFQRNVVWTFEDIRMLIGTDMPIFGGPNRPCISLRLRDMNKPINVLTGIDYWLDNLMCNVPEVVMCYHLDGIVQRYEIIKTEDLPYLENSQFSPQVVRNVAQNILAFLKANATKEGHTYWLFKGRNDDVVKLYDLSTLCKIEKDPSQCDEKQENPFTVPVAMLLYTVARNMKTRTQEISAKTAGNIRALLDNCIKLLPKEKYPQIVTSSHYILSDLHIPAGIDPKDPKFNTNDNDSDTQSIYEEDEEDDEDYENDELFNLHELSRDQNVAVQNICDTLKEFQLDTNLSNKQDKRRPLPLIASTEDRCSIALEHISQGLSCLQYFDKNEEEFIKETEARAKDEEKVKIIHEEQHPNMAKPFKPIPLPYESLNEPKCKLTKAASLDSNEEYIDDMKTKKSKYKKSQVKDLKPITTIPQQQPAQLPQQIAVSFNSQLFGSWNVHLKLLLLEKACLTYATLAEYNYVEQKYGASLRAIYMSCKCQQVVLKYMSSLVSQKSCLLGRAGDCFFQMSKDWQNIKEHLRDFAINYDAEEYIQKELVKELGSDDCSELIAPQENIELLMASSCASYETALEHVTTTNDDNADEEAQHEILRRLGNVRNELGLKYMFWAQEEYAKYTQENNDNSNDHKDATKGTTIEIPGIDIEKNEETISKSKSKTKEEPLYLELAMKSYDCLIRGIKAFGLVKDNVNLAFLYCNMGRFMRFRAHLIIPKENTNMILQQKRFYNEAFSYYEKAKDVLGSRKSSAELWDLVNWELSTATFMLAKQLQDDSSTDEVCRSDLEKEVLDLLQKSLKLCDVEHPGSRQILYTYRSGLIHKRIASFHYSQLRNNLTDTATLPKTTLQLCKYHYEKSANILDALKEAGDYLVVQLERISLHEFLAENSTSNSKKIKLLQQALEICLNSKSLFTYALSNLNSSAEAKTTTTTTTTLTATNSQTANNEREFSKHILLFESRLQFVLKTLIKLWLSGGVKDHKQKADLYKKMYMETLNIRNVTGTQKHKPICAKLLPQHFANLLERLAQLEHSHANNSTNNNTS